MFGEAPSDRDSSELRETRSAPRAAPGALARAERDRCRALRSRETGRAAGRRRRPRDPGRLPVERRVRRVLALALPGDVSPRRRASLPANLWYSPRHARRRALAGARAHRSSSRKILCFTGAGVSTNSKIPDFRGPQGAVPHRSPTYFSDFVASEDARRRLLDVQARGVTRCFVTHSRTRRTLPSRSSSDSGGSKPS